MKIPQSYRSRPDSCGHPSIPIDKDCSSCSLGELRQQHNQRVKEEDRDEPLQYCVGGAGPDDLRDVKLIVISDYPGPYELEHNFPMYDKTSDSNFKEYKRGILQSINAGSLLRSTISQLLNLDTYTDTYITNAVKCYPAKTTVIENAHVRPCAVSWLSYELNKLDIYCPEAPILVCGTNAFRGLKASYAAYRSVFEEVKSLNDLRRNVIKLDKHICTGTFNPAIIARSIPTIAEETKVYKGTLRISKNKPLSPPIPLSPMHKFVGDLLILKEYINA